MNRSKGAAKTPAKKPAPKPGKTAVGDIDARTAARLIGACSDLALVMDGDGTILEVLSQDDDLRAQGAQAWRGKSWAQTVTVESRQKVQALIDEAVKAGAEAATRWRQINHPVGEGADLPLLYSAIGLPGGAEGGRRVVAFGRDLRATVALQRRLIEAQQGMERDYWRFREAETRYRHLFETSAEAVLIVDGATQKVIEANPAAKALLGGSRARIVGSTLASLVEGIDAERVQDLLAAARTVGRQEAARVTLVNGELPVTLSASVFRQDKAAFALVRITPLPPPVAQPAARRREAADAAAAKGSSANGTTVWQSFLETSPDALAFCDAGGHVIAVNRAFLTLAQLSSEEQARGRSLDAWLGRTGVELGVLIATLRERGRVGLFATELRGEYGGSAQVEVSASSVEADGQTMLAFALRDTERRGIAEAKGTSANWSRSPGELAELVGRTPLKDIVAETTDVIEQMCIQTALQMTGDNRASAAQLLGLSRQSLYVKLRRFGLIGAGSGEDEG